MCLGLCMTPFSSTNTMIRSSPACSRKKCLFLCVRGGECIWPLSDYVDCIICHQFCNLCACLCLPRCTVIDECFFQNSTCYCNFKFSYGFQETLSTHPEISSYCIVLFIDWFRLIIHLNYNFLDSGMLRRSVALLHMIIKVT